ncbi:DUF4199 domain-containing protein [Agriterribacter sp.]|uniref:DUF4199 domain-containing protein n=1 Tax=Agriterribacter sp. TaxID=2821509 RepID=UPI002CB3FF21|nr:DUF4199 domain-containing protein [Agriterribacter sp.]HTN05773.1 DUF4199 domain-containing protein [Agriterribacter sp.]
MEKKRTDVGLTYGLISGLASVIFGLMLYLGGVKWFVHPIAYAGFVIPIAIAVLAGLKQKKLNEGYIDFAATLKVVFTTFVIGTVISTLFNYVLFNFIDVPFREALTQETAEKAQQMMQKFGANQEQIDKAAEDMMKGNNYSFSKQMLGAAFFCIFWFVVSVIIAAIIKKKRPEFPAAAQ